MSTKKITLSQTLITIIGIALVAFLFVSADTKEKLVVNLIDLEEAVLSANGVILPIKWNDLGKQMVDTGVIDKVKFEELYAQRGGLDDSAMELLYGVDSGNIVMNSENSKVLLNMLWAFGLANKNRILEEGPMTDEKYGGDAGKFASTGGWGLSVGNAMEHYSKHAFITLTQEQQALVERVSKNIYRPCCGNSVHFPDCNHGMAMLGLLELLASENVSEAEMYDIALKVNSYWFPETYLTLAEYFGQKGSDWKDIDPKEVLSSTYSSGQGYSRILEEMQPTQIQRGAGCSV